MSRGCSGGACAATTTTTASMLAAIGAPPLRHVRVGAREQGAAGQHRGDAVRRRPAARRARGRRRRGRSADARRAPATAPPRPPRRAAFVEPHRADAGGDAGHHAAVAGDAGQVGLRPRRRAGAGGAVRPVRRGPRPTSSSRKSSSSGRRPAGLLCPERRLAQLGGALGQSVPLAGVELGEEALESSALLLVHRWRCPFVGFRHAVRVAARTGHARARPRASPGRAGVGTGRGRAARGSSARVERELPTPEPSPW